MIKENFTAIACVIDESGSMSHLQNDTIGSFNTLLKEQQEVPGEAVFTLCTFSDDYRLVHDFVKLNDVPNLSTKTYRPSGSTALLDAMGTTIDFVGKKLAALPEEERPSKILFVTITDGHENASHRYTAQQVKSMVEHQQNVYNWVFVFIGANMDAISVGTSLGVSAANSLNYTSDSVGTARTYSIVSKNLSSYRRMSGESTSQIDFFNQTSSSNNIETPKK